MLTLRHIAFAAALTLLSVTAPAQAIGNAEQFSTALTSAQSDEERAQLIAEHAQFATGALAESLQLRGAEWWEKGDFPKALPLLEAAAHLAGATGQKYTRGRALNNIGIIHSAQGRYGEGLRILQQSLALWEELGEEERAVSTTMNIGSVFRWQRNFDQALAAHRRVLEYGEQKRDRRHIGKASINIGFILVEQGKPEAAVEHFSRAIDLENALDARSLSTALTGIGDIRMQQGRFEDATTFFSRALNVQKKSNDRPSAAYTIGSLAWLSYKQGKFEDAIRHANDSLAIADDLGLRETIWRVAYTLGSSHLARNEFDRAKFAYDRSIATIEKMRDDVVGSEHEQQRFFSDKLHAYQDVVELCIKQGKTAEALDYAERAKARVLLDVARSGRSRVQQAMTPDERAREADLRQALAHASAVLQKEENSRNAGDPRTVQARTERDRARSAYDRFETELYSKHPELQVKRGELEWPGAEAIAALLDPDTAVLEYVFAEDQYYAILLTRGADAKPELESWVLPGGAALISERVTSFRKQLGKRDNVFLKAASELYDLLIRRAAPRLNRASTLIIIPDRALWELPFQALHDGRQFMLESHTVLYAPSLAVVAAMQRTPQALLTDPRLFAIGNPVTRKKALPNAAREVRRIAALYGRERSKVLIGQQAIEAVVKRELIGPAILHFATHGDRDDGDPMNSRVLLTVPRSGEAEDGALEAREFMEMEIAARLVILSACETALGNVSTGEGMIGLTWALFIAGSPTTIASQWQVDSQSTTELMISFHRVLKEAPRTLGSSIAVANALRRAALPLLRSTATRHPYYWAGFVTVGTRL